MREDVESGAALADAMKKHPKTFDPLFSNMIAAGEAGGILDTNLKRLAVYIEKNVKLKGEVKSAMIYPVAVIVIAAVVVGAILWKVIPTFASLFAGLGAQLPLPTRVVIAASDMLVAYGWILIIILGLIGYALKSYYATNNGRHTIDAILLKLPILGNILRKVAVARFCRTNPAAARGPNHTTCVPVDRRSRVDQRLHDRHVSSTRPCCSDVSITRGRVPCRAGTPLR